MFQNPRRGMQARNFTTNVSKILDLKSFPEDIFRKLTLGAPEIICAWLWDSIGLKITDSRSPVMMTGQILFSPNKQCYRAKRIKRQLYGKYYKMFASKNDRSKWPARREFDRSSPRSGRTLSALTGRYFEPWIVNLFTESRNVLPWVPEDIFFLSILMVRGVSVSVLRLGSLIKP